MRSITMHARISITDCMKQVSRQCITEDGTVTITVSLKQVSGVSSFQFCVLVHCLVVKCQLSMELC